MILLTGTIVKAAAAVQNKTEMVTEHIPEAPQPAKKELCVKYVKKNMVTKLRTIM